MSIAQHNREDSRDPRRESDVRMRSLEDRVLQMEETMRTFGVELMTNNVDDHVFFRSHLEDHKSLIDQTNERFSISEPKLEQQFVNV